jgi:hypothetical protein
MTMVITARHSSFQGEKKMPIWYYVKIMSSGGKRFGSLLDTNNRCIVEEYSSQVCFQIVKWFQRKWIFQIYLCQNFVLQPSGEFGFPIEIFFGGYIMKNPPIQQFQGHRDCDHMVVEFTTTYAISAYHHWCCEFESRPRRGAQHYVIKFVSDLRRVSGFLRVLRFPPPIKLTAMI